MEARETLQLVRQVKWALLCRFASDRDGIRYRVTSGRYSRNNRRDGLSVVLTGSQ